MEPRRAAGYGIAHYSWLCINAKEAEDVKLAREVIAAIPEFLSASNVLGIGEIGLNKNTRNEATVFLEQVELAVRHDETILIHTPHLADKLRGTRMILDMLADFPALDHGRVVIDHVEEHTIRPAARRRLLGRHDALPGDEVFAGAGLRPGRAATERSGCSSTPPATGGRLGRQRCPISSWRCGPAGMPKS